MTATPLTFVATTETTEFCTKKFIQSRPNSKEVSSLPRQLTEYKCTTENKHTTEARFVSTVLICKFVHNKKFSDMFSRR